MAKQKREHLFKPGQSGNPNGRPKADPEMQALRALSLEQFKEVAVLVLTGKRQEASDLINDQNAPLFKRWVAKIADQGFNRGDQQALEILMNRLVGKVPDKIEATAAIVAAHVPADELASRLEQLFKKPEGDDQEPG